MNLATHIQFEDGPIADATGSHITISKYGIRIKFPNGDKRYYFGVGAIAAGHATINFGNIPELENENAPKPSEKLMTKYGTTPCHMGVLAVGIIQGNPTGVGAAGCLNAGTTVFNFGC